MPEHDYSWVQRLERRLGALERELATVEAVIETYELLLGMAWGLIEELRGGSSLTHGRDDP